MKHKLHFDVGEAIVFLTQESCLFSPYPSLMLNNRNNAWGSTISLMTIVEMTQTRKDLLSRYLLVDETA